MPSSKDAVRSQRRRELDARRSKSRVRLGSCLQSWVQLKEKLGFSLHSELAQHLLESYFSRVCFKCSGGRKGEIKNTLPTTTESLQELILLIHNHGQKCPLLPVLQSRTITNRAGQDQSTHRTGRREKQVKTEPKDASQSSEMEICLKCTCEGGHHFLWSPTKREFEKKGTNSENKKNGNSRDVTPSSPKSPGKRGRKRLKEPVTETVRQELVTCVKTRRWQGEKSAITLNQSGQKSDASTAISGDNTNSGVTVTETAQDAVPQEGSDVSALSSPELESPADSPEMATDDLDSVCIENQSPSDIVSSEEVAVLNLTNRGTQERVDQTEKHNVNKRAGALQNNNPQSLKDDISKIGGKRKRKITPKVILPCEYEGCDKIFSSRQYLNHHVKYQHLQQKTFSCSHPTCNKSFNFKKHLKEHEKLHTNQRDYICEFCARAFRTSSNLIIHRRIHTGEKPLQCEVCGFTCRQKASLNWHMRKHNAESTYQFPCEICGRRFEKRDNVTAHRSKSHLDHNASTPETQPFLFPPSNSVPHPLRQHGSSPAASMDHADLV
ncbi:zinc finger protein 692 [Myxocyprinus asiaticus]|uniref:zinc finger protein 692 n=1 Tax=Myxocyprinus asiaticus TaxID=70543 RepID=UPI002222F2DF|nr:zinc finger protein 692 [Myxocyprinus asiaticus]